MRLRPSRWFSARGPFNYKLDVVYDLFLNDMLDDKPVLGKGDQYNQKFTAGSGLTIEIWIACKWFAYASEACVYKTAPNGVEKIVKDWHRVRPRRKTMFRLSDYIDSHGSRPLTYQDIKKGII